MNKKIRSHLAEQSWTVEELISSQQPVGSLKGYPKIEVVAKNTIISLA